MSLIQASTPTGCGPAALSALNPPAAPGGGSRNVSRNPPCLLARSRSSRRNASRLQRCASALFAARCARPSASTAFVRAAARPENSAARAADQRSETRRSTLCACGWRRPTAVAARDETPLGKEPREAAVLFTDFGIRMQRVREEWPRKGGGRACGSLTPRLEDINVRFVKLPYSLLSRFHLFQLGFKRRIPVRSDKGGLEAEGRAEVPPKSRCRRRRPVYTCSVPGVSCARFCSSTCHGSSGRHVIYVVWWVV